MIEEDSLPVRHVRNNSPTFKNWLWRYGPVIVWAGLIFIGSSDLLSASHTSSFLMRPLRALFPSASEATLLAIHFTLRKLGHFSEYAVLALLTARALRGSTSRLLRERWLWISLAAVIVYSLSDEFHQSFVDSRTASIFDCMIDTAGGFGALLIVRIRTSRNTNVSVSPSPKRRGSPFEHPPRFRRIISGTSFKEITMGILDRLSPTAQFIEVIEWLDDSGNTMLYRFPVRDQEIKNGAQLIVRESQAAVFVHEGQIADVFGPGRYSVEGGNTPILSKLGAWKYGFNSPMKSEVYFVNTKQFTDLKWGTSNPVMMRDTDFGMVRLRAFGIYSMRVADPRELIKQIAGTNARFVTEDIEGQLRRTLVSGFSDALAESKIAALDLASNYDELSVFSKQKLQDEFKSLGLELTKFVVENISLPQEVEAAMDKRTQMGVLGDMGRYTQFEAAQAMRDAAQNPGGGAGLGAGLGAGFAVGNAMANAMTDAMRQRGATVPEGSGTVAGNTAKCVKCGAAMAPGAKFCSECGATQEPAKCANCQNELKPGAKFCDECGTKVG